MKRKKNKKGTLATPILCMYSCRSHRRDLGQHQAKRSTKNEKQTQLYKRVKSFFTIY